MYLPVSEEDPAQLTYAPRASGRSPAKRVSSAKVKARRVGPKRAMSAYFFFAAEARTKIAAERPELKMTDQAKEMGVQWKRMSAADKQKYVEMAQKDKERYASEKAEYYKDYPQPGPKRKNTRWTAEEMALLKSVSVCLAFLEWLHRARARVAGLTCRTAGCARASKNSEPEAGLASSQATSLPSHAAQ